MVTVVMLKKKSEQALIIALFLTWIHQLIGRLSVLLIEISTKIRDKGKNLKKVKQYEERAFLILSLCIDFIL